MAESLHMKRKNPVKICLALLLALLPAISAEATPNNQRWVGPLAGKLIAVRTFDGAAYRANHYGRAHLGVDLLSEVGAQVFAPTDGVIAYVGVINSIPIVVIAHANSRHTGGAVQRLRTKIYKLFKLLSSIAFLICFDVNSLSSVKILGLIL